MTASSTLKTWGDALDWTWQNKWKRLNSAKTNSINAGHVTSYCGRSFPLSRLGKNAWWVEFQNELLDEHPNWQPATVNRVTSAASAVLRYTFRAGLHGVKPPEFDRLKEGEARFTYFTKAQVDQLADVAAHIFDRPELSDAILTSAYTGCRQGELLNLKAEDVDLAADCLWIGGKPKRETKSKNVRSIPLHDKIRAVLTSRLDRKYLFKNDWTNKDQLYNAFKKVRKQCGISEDYVWHSLRHTFATWIGESNSVRTAQELLGHKDVTQTLRYMKATDEAARAAILSI